MEKQWIGEHGKSYASFRQQLGDDEGFKQMGREHAQGGGRKQAEIEYELHKFVIEWLGDDMNGNAYADFAVRELKFSSEWLQLFMREIERLPA